MQTNWKVTMKLTAIIIVSLFISVSAFCNNIYSKQLDFRLGVEKRAPGVYRLVHEDASDEDNNAENSSALSIERLFYITPNRPHHSFSNELLTNMKKHAKSIDIIAPQIYQLDENGIIVGTIDPKLIAFAKENSIKIMPLIINLSFDQDKFHHFLCHPDAQKRAISSLLSLCKQYHFYGIQFDFENINVNDKAEFTHFFKLAADRLHQHNFKISIAVVPHIPEPDTDYNRWCFENWSGAYDYQALSQSSDFVSMMSYDRHTSLTTPGPLAPVDWVEKTIQNLLKVVPTKKLSLGIPAYSGYWSTGKFNISNIPEQYKYRSKESKISYSKVLGLLNQFHPSLVWQDQWRSYYAIYSHDNMIEYLFVEDAKSFKEKLKLAKHYRLHGISVWKFGLEDPNIWN
jgi:spore germination protein